MTENWSLKVKHREWYYFRLHMTIEEITVQLDATTWKLAILKCLQQTAGLFGQAVEFDIMKSRDIDGVDGRETIVRVHYDDRVVFSQCITTGTFANDISKDTSLEASIRIVSQSASLEGVVTRRLGWDI